MMCVICILKDESFRALRVRDLLSYCMSSNPGSRSQTKRRLHGGVGFIFIGEEQNIEYHRKSKG